MKTIYLDMDGVLVDFVGAALNLYKVPPEYRTKVDCWDGIPKVVSEYHDAELTDDQLWKDVIDAGSAFWSNIRWLPWGRAIYDMCCAAAPTVIMTTPTGAPSAHGKMDWFVKHLGPTRGVDAVRFAITNCKHHFARETACLIDDNSRNCQKYREHGGHALLFPAPWNEYKRPPTPGEATGLVEAFLEEWK